MTIEHWTSGPTPSAPTRHLRETPRPTGRRLARRGIRRGGQETRMRGVETNPPSRSFEWRALDATVRSIQRFDEAGQPLGEPTELLSAPLSESRFVVAGMDVRGSSDKGRIPVPPVNSPGSLASFHFRLSASVMLSPATGGRAPSRTHPRRPCSHRSLEEIPAHATDPSPTAKDFFL
jgi:hypothetical protein